MFNEFELLVIRVLHRSIHLRHHCHYDLEHHHHQHTSQAPPCRFIYPPSLINPYAGTKRNRSHSASGQIKQRQTCDTWGTIARDPSTNWQVQRATEEVTLPMKPEVSRSSVDQTLKAASPEVIRRFMATNIEWTSLHV